MKKSWIIVATLVIGLIAGLLGYSAVEKELPLVTRNFPVTIKQVMPSSVHIMCSQWQGSGVAIAPNIVVTARHVAKNGGTYTITTDDGREFKGTQVLNHKDYDIAFIKVDPLGVVADKLGISSKLTPAKFGSIKDCVLGQPVFIIGSPFGKINFNSVSTGHISGLDRDWDSLSSYGEPYGWSVAFTSTSAAHPGNSGGPVFTMDGVCRGLLVGGFSPSLNCSMPCDLFLADLDNIKALFAMKKYESESDRKEIDYSRTVETREDYYIFD